MRLPPATPSPARIAPGLVMLLLFSGCAAQPKLGIEEASGRPALTWQSGDGGSEASKVDAEKKTERQLLAELQEAERSGTDDLGLGTTLYNLAVLRRQQGALAESEGLYRRALEIRERAGGPDHPDVAATLNNLAGLKAAQGNYDAAQPLLERALAIREAVLGADHTLTAQSLNNLALLYAAQGNASAAEPLYRRALAILEKTDALQRPEDLSRVLDNYAALLYETGRDAEAEALEARARGLRAAAVKR